MNVVQYDNGNRPIYSKAINQVKSNLPVGVKHTLIAECPFELRNLDYRCDSEIVRLTEATRNPDMLWLDSDCLIKKWPDFQFKPGKPYWSERWWEAIFYVNGCCDFFKSLLDEYHTKNLHKPCWLRRLFKDHADEFEVIPEGYFVHMCFSMAYCSGSGFSNAGNSDFYLYKDSFGNLQFDIKF